MTKFGRSEILDYAKQTFGCEANHPFEKFPSYIALRHDEGGKWFGLIMDVPKDRLGLDGDEKIDVIDVKCSPSTVDELKGKPGFLPAYHMDKKHWITILLDGSVSKKDVTRLISDSHDLIG